MKKSVFIYSLTALLTSNCSDSKSSKSAPIESPKLVQQAASPQVSTATPTPSLSPTPVSTGSETEQTNPIKVKSTFSLYTLPAQDAKLVRNAAKVISIAIKPLKVTSSAGLNGSLLTASCGTTVVANSKVILLTENSENEPAYQPAIVIPAEVTCSEDIKVSLDVYGFSVELGDVLEADVVSAGKAVIVQ